MNFLVSAVGQSHSEVLEKYLKTKYINHSSINEETLMFERAMSTFYGREECFDCYIISFLDKGSEESDGIISSIKNILQTKIRTVMENQRRILERSKGYFIDLAQ